MTRFKKGYYSEEKIHNEVEYDSVMKMKEVKTGQIVEYRLMGVIHHYGTLNRGHYFANVKVEGDWYECNDEKVNQEKIDLRGNRSPYVYILIY